MTVNSKIISFLKQRRIAGMKRCVPNGQLVRSISEELLMKFNRVKQNDDWRNLREIYNNQSAIQTLLPSENGAHAHVRSEMLDLIELADRIASHPRVPGAFTELNINRVLNLH
jgi:hypothetical protein